MVLLEMCSDEVGKQNSVEVLKFPTDDVWHSQGEFLAPLARTLGAACHFANAAGEARATLSDLSRGFLGRLGERPLAATLCHPAGFETRPSIRFTVGSAHGAGSYDDELALL